MTPSLSLEIENETVHINYFACNVSIPLQKLHDDIYLVSSGKNSLSDNNKLMVGIYHD